MEAYKAQDVEKQRRFEQEGRIVFLKEMVVIAHVI